MYILLLCFIDDSDLKSQSLSYLYFYLITLNKKIVLFTPHNFISSWKVLITLLYYIFFNLTHIKYGNWKLNVRVTCKNHWPLFLHIKKSLGCPNRIELHFSCALTTKRVHNWSYFVRIGFTCTSVEIHTNKTIIRMIFLNQGPQ